MILAFLQIGFGTLTKFVAYNPSRTAIPITRTCYSIGTPRAVRRIRAALFLFDEGTFLWK